MALFARDEKDLKTDPFPSPDAAAEDTRPRPAPAPVERERAGGREREMSVHLGRGSRVNGKLAFDGPARIDGEVEGEITAQDILVIEENAVVAAQIVCTKIVIKGKVTGNVRASERVEIVAPARLEGDVVTPTLVVHEGARLDGRCSMGGAESRAEPRSTPAKKTA